MFDPVTGLRPLQAVSSLSTEVDIIDGKVALTIIALQTFYLDVSASATFRMETGVPGRWMRTQR